MISASPQQGDNRRPPFDASRRSGVALVLVLAFIVLLTGLIVAYFARSMTSRQLSNSSAGQTKSAMLAQSASDIVISGLKQEIVSGSAAPSPSPAHFYVPLAPANAVPVRFPTPAPSPSPAVDLIPNLVRRSMSGDSSNGTNPVPAPAVPSLASAVNSATAPSLNGRVVTPARWNSHYLIPSYDAVASTAQPSPSPPSTPDGAVKFTAPDWVLVTRGGPEVETSLGSGTTAVNNPISTNQHYVIGRYAYAIYDEGGLLDMNVAGHPTPIASPTPTGTPPTPFTQTQISQKSSLAMAELAQLPIVKAPSSPEAATDTAEYFPQAMVDSIVGWRNYASANTPSGTFPTFTFNASSDQNWFTNFAANNTTGFLKVYGGTGTSSVPTDQGFLSRQQLLHLCTSLGFSPNVLQFMGTFSRALEQPSYVPDPNRPRITSPTVTPPNPSLADGYKGNNDAVGGDDVINPAFLNVRVQSAFPRINGTTAVVGEPLVKTKFALSRLALVTFGSTCPQTTGGNHIWDYFGLSRSAITQPWTYYHGATHIMTMSEVASANREPDFAELLKATIDVGSLGKAGPHLHGFSGQDWGNYQYGVDVSVDNHVLQIMANLIDQYDTDSYPTIIQYTFPSLAGSVTHTVRGVEDLPYFYRYHPMSVVSKTPAAVALASDTVTFYHVNADGSRGSVAATIPFCKPSAPLATTDQGQAAMLMVPEVWNPHDSSPTRGTLPGPRPTSFRITAVTDDPLDQSSWNTYAQIAVQGQTTDIPNIAAVYPTPAPMTKATTAITFSDNNGQLFREPTLLWRPDAPTGAGLAAPNGSLAGPYTDANFSGTNFTVQYLGLCVGVTPVNFTQTIDSTKYVAADPSTGANLPATTNFLFQPRNIWYGTDFPATGPAYEQMTFRIEYMDSNGQYQVYDEKYGDFHQMGHPSLVVNKNDNNAISGTWPINRWANPVASGEFASNASAYDPRTSRFGIGTSSSFDTNYVGNQNNSPLYESGPAAYWNSDANGISFGSSKYTIMETERPAADLGAEVLYSNPGMTSDPGQNVNMLWGGGVGFSASNGQNSSANEYDGVLFAQNNPAVTTPSHDHNTMVPLYYEDADGTARRAMGAYMDTLTFSSTSNPFGSPTSGSQIGLPLQKSNNYTTGGVGTPTSGNVGRPIILNRPFQSVGEMSYAFRGIPWKQLDFFTPESGDAALLDVFCLDEPPTDGMVAGKVDLNTHQVPVLKALLAGAYRDEVTNIALTPKPTYAFAALSGAEAANIASRLVGITTDATNAWRGPLANISSLVGRYVATPGSTSGYTDFFTFTGVGGTQARTYAGFSAALDSTVYATGTAASYTPKIQRLRESAVRALANNGQTRVWNLMIDVVAQTGHYTPSSSSLAQFAVDGEQRRWVHVAIDRFTGEVIDKQTEVVTE